MISDLIENRQIRIFISSTFQDMKDERDYLVKTVFPSLRTYCADRGVTLQELDLRWGITREQSERGEVVDICLKEIKNTMPFFIGLLGERYGWMPEPEQQRDIANNTSVFKEYPWIQEELEKNNTSITEIEIQDGVLRSRKKVNAYFYFRSGKMEVPNTEAYKEEPGSVKAKKLQSLKQTLRGQKIYPVADYDSPEHLGCLVERDFKELVDALFPKGAVSPLKKERLEQAAFLKSKTVIYEPVLGVEAKLKEFAEGAGQCLVIAGESGSGKSAIIANWIKNRTAWDGGNYSIILSANQGRRVIIVKYAQGSSANCGTFFPFMRIKRVQ
jgi:hypothetical protein